MITNDRTLIWSATENVYNKSITLSEPLTHFEEYEIYASGMENATAGVHVAKTSFNTTENKVNGCDSWGYSPWTTTYNYILGANIKISGSSGFVGSSYYMGQGSNTTAYAAGKWVNDDAPKMLQPFKIFGLDRKPTYKLNLIRTNESTISADTTIGYEFDITTLTGTPIRGWDLTGYDITGATLTGNEFMWNDNDVTATPSCSAIPSYTVTILPAEHGSVIASMPSGYRGEIVTLTNTPDEGWYYGGYDTTGCTINKYGEFVLTADAIIQPKFSDVEFRTLTLLHSEGGTLTADAITGVPGDTINLSTAYNTYWRFSGYQLTGDGTIANNVYTFGTDDATICACYKKNAFTATGTWNKGSNVNVSRTNKSTSWETLYNSYAIHGAHTGNVPTAWYNSSNQWRPKNVSGYSMNMRAKMTLQKTGGGVVSFRAYTILNGSTSSNVQTWSNQGAGTQTITLYYDKTITTSYCSTAGYRIGSQFFSHNNTTVSYAWGAKYIATGTNGSWTATGYAP